MVRYRGTVLFPSAAAQYGALYRATRETIVGAASQCPRVTADPRWTALQWLMIARLILVRRHRREPERRSEWREGEGDGVPAGWRGEGGAGVGGAS